MPKPQPNARQQMMANDLEMSVFQQMLDEGASLKQAWALRDQAEAEQFLDDKQRREIAAMRKVLAETRREKKKIADEEFRLERRMEQERKRSQEKFRGELRQTGQLAATTFAAGTAGILGFTAAASPLAINTFRGSLELLSAEIGGSFLPYIAKAVGMIQRGERQIRGMNKETKDSVAYWAVAATAAGAAGLAVKSTVGVITRMGPAGVAAAAGVMTLAGAFRAAEAAADKARAAMAAVSSGAVKPREVAINLKGPAKAGGTSILQAQGIGDPKERIKFIDKAMARNAAASDDYQKKNSGFSAELAGNSRNFAHNATDWLAGWFGMRSGIGPDNRHERAAEFGQVGIALKQMKRSALMDSSPWYKSWLGGAENRTKTIDPNGILAGAMGIGRKPQYGGLEDTYKAMQIAALKSPLDQAIEQKQLENELEMLRLLGLEGPIAQEIRRLSPAVGR